MKKFIFFLFLLFLLVGCAEDLPPAPSPPGGDAGVGRAVGGVQISQALPAWAAPIRYTDITPERAKFGDSIAVTVQRPSGVSRDFLIFKQVYVFNKKVYETSRVGLWEAAVADAYSSGVVVGDWYKNKAVFYVPVSDVRFTPGLNYVVVYYCVDSGSLDSQGKRVWDCNGNKWGLGAFEVTLERYPDILIERNIENNRYTGSVRGSAPGDAFVGVPISAGALGDSYTASYVDLKNVKTDVSVVRVLNASLLKKNLANSSSWLEPKWATKGGVTCGFYTPATSANSFSWLSGSWWITVKTFGILDEAKIGNYATVYRSDCNLLLEFKALAGITDVCGNSFLGAGEECEKNVVCASPKLCNLTTCKCYTPPVPPVCNNTVKEGSEECERGVSCANASDICNLDTCRCIPLGCGNNILESGEQCERNSQCNVTAGEYCIDCECIEPLCGDDVVTPDEECEWDEDCTGGDICVDCGCVAPFCGDTFVTGTEECDVNASCVNASRICDLKTCKCIASGCGNNVKEAGEDCEGVGTKCTKDNVNGTCGAECKCNYCGDYKINQPSEQCEPPNSLTCDANCMITGPASAVTAYVCKRGDDHYLSTSLPCPDGDAQRIQARLLPLSTVKKADMVKIVQCYYSAGNEHRIAFDTCPSGYIHSSSLGFAYKTEKIGTVPVAICRFDKNSEYFTMTESCPSGSTYIQTFYALPFCEESDKSRNLLERGITKSLIDNTEYVDSCEDGALREYSCDALALETPYGIKEETVSCPAGYSCKDGACVTATPVVEADTVPLFACMRRTMWHRHGTSENIHMDDYHSSIYTGSDNICEGSMLAIQGRIFKEQQENTVPLMKCFWQDRQEYYLEINDCTGENKDTVGELGYIYTTQEPGTIPLRNCRWDVPNGEEHFATTGLCPDRSTELQVWYILPSCEDTDGGRIPRVKGWINAFDTNWKFTSHLFEDSCDGTAYVKEYYCNTDRLPNGYYRDTVPCPAGTSCSDGACVASLPVGNAVYFSEFIQTEDSSQGILLIFAIIAMLGIVLINYLPKK